MKTSIKFLVIALSASLTACGGGGGGNSNAPAPVTPEAKEVLFDGSDMAYSFKFEVDASTQALQPVTQEIYVRSGTLYRKSTDAPEFDDYLLTDEALYIPETAASYDPAKGVRTDFIKIKSPLEWQSTQYSQNGVRDLTRVVKWRAVNLANREIAPAIEPSSSAGIAILGFIPGTTYSVLGLPQKIFVHQPKFSAQAKCLHMESIKNSKVYYTFQPDDAKNTLAGVSTLLAWQQQQNALATAQRPLGPLQTKLVAGYKIGWLTFGTTGPIGSPTGLEHVEYAIEYQGKLVRLEAKTELNQSYLSGLEKTLASWSTVYPKNLLDQVKANYLDTCTYYNKAAIDDIKQAIQQAKTTEVSVTPFIKSAPVTPETPVYNCWGNLTFC